MRKMGEFFTNLSNKYMPDPFLFAILLTFITVIIGIIFTDNGPFDMLKHWNKGFWTLLKFSMQMCLILVTGYALATTKIVSAAIDMVADLPKSTGGAAMLVCVVTSLAAIINWGLGLIVGALMARQVALRGYEKGIPIHLPLLVAAAYIGQGVWHGGLSGSAPLLVATKGHFLEQQIGIIPVSETLFSPLNIVVLVFAFICVPFLVKMVAPKHSDGSVVTIDKVLPNVEELLRERKEGVTVEKLETVASKIEHSMILSVLIGIMGTIVVIWYFVTNGFKLNLNIVNFTFLFAGIILHKTPMNYIKAITEGTKSCSGIILQFPFYSGIMGMMKFSGLVAVVAGWFIGISNDVTYPIFTFISAGLVNVFVPSGGGQWAVQGPVIVEAAKALNVSIPKAVMAMAYGDQLTNLIQPFWALPILGITGVKARQMMGYGIAVMFVWMIFYIIALLIVPA